MHAPTIGPTSSRTAAGGWTALPFTPDSSQQPARQFDPATLRMGMDILVDSKIDAINPVVEKLMRILTESGCPHENEFAVETALREALANAIVHGNHGDTRKKVRVCCDCDSTKGILIIVRDEGEGFDPTKVQSPLVGSMLPPSTEEASFSSTCSWTKPILRMAAEKFICARRINLALGRASGLPCLRTYFRHATYSDRDLRGNSHAEPNHQAHEV